MVVDNTHEELLAGCGLEDMKKPRTENLRSGLIKIQLRLSEGALAAGRQAPAASAAMSVTGTRALRQSWCQEGFLEKGSKWSPVETVLLGVSENEGYLIAGS